MQYANGGDLQNYLEENFKKLTWDNKKKLAFQIAEGLNYLHNENILHRDLHSKNIVIHDGSAKITDFGISKIQDNTTTNIGTIGVAPYIEPKRLLDQNYKYTKPSDIYSFGVLMWEISSGRTPFKDCDINTVLLHVRSGTRETPVPDTPKEYENLYKNCWRQEPKQRPDIKEVLHEFKKMGVGIKLSKDSESQISYCSDNNSTSASNVQASCDPYDFALNIHKTYNIPNRGRDKGPITCNVQSNKRKANAQVKKSNVTNQL
ncbi:kinase-like domain-containing protein [Rhizophagus diaphanus]|nr:kinase-like domain-containing protein [Rhizophagus diaphanus] [Rhizophagus sp. MUCL 43196]